MESRSGAPTTVLGTLREDENKAGKLQYRSHMTGPERCPAHKDWDRTVHRMTLEKTCWTIQRFRDCKKGENVQEKGNEPLHLYIPQPSTPIIVNVIVGPRSMLLFPVDERRGS